MRTNGILTWLVRDYVGSTKRVDIKR